MKKFRNTRSLVEQSLQLIDNQRKQNLMHFSIRERDKKKLTLEDGRTVIEFLNCSYLGLDIHPEVIEAAAEAIRKWGVHFCCARSRASLDLNFLLEERLSQLFKAHAVTFPSVSAAHASVMPLIASGVLLGRNGGVTLIYDRFAHASMQFLRPILSQEAEIVQIPHNDMIALERELDLAKRKGHAAVYVADSIYSMGGAMPIEKVLALAADPDLYLYIDDAHGTSIFGDSGEGYLMSRLGRALPEKIFATFSLSKGFGCNGGGVILPTKENERLVRYFGQTYCFSTPLDFSIMGAAMKVLDWHFDGTVKKLQSALRENVRLFLSNMPLCQQEIWSPICMIPAGSPEKCTCLATHLLSCGYYAPSVFFPVVAKDKAQLRVCMSVLHTPNQIRGLAARLSDWFEKLSEF